MGNSLSKTKRFDDRQSLERARHELKKTRAALLGPWIGTLLWPTGTLCGYRDYVDTHQLRHLRADMGELYTLTRTLAVSHC